MRKFSKLFFPAIAIAIMGMQSCSRADDGLDPNPIDPPGGGGSGTQVATSIRGCIITEDGAYVPGATVKAGTSTAITDASGTFYFKNVNVDAANGYVRVEKPGYFVTGSSFIPSAGKTSEVRLSLVSTTRTRNYISISPTSIGSLNADKLEWTGAFFQLQNGTAYTGVVSPVFVPTITYEHNKIPMIAGDFRGIDAAGNEKALTPYSYASIMLQTNTGQPLKFAGGSTATVETYLHPFIQSAAPSSIPLFYFNDTTGRWIQHGTATKAVNRYVYTIDRPGHWLCAVAQAGIRLKGDIKSQLTNEPIGGQIIKFYRNNELHHISAVTDSSGHFDLLVPANTQLKLGIGEACTYDMTSKDLGPYSSNASAGTLAMNAIANNVYNFKGSVKNCGGSMVNSGAIYIFTGSTGYHVAPVVNGQFSFTHLACAPGAIRYYALDHSTGLKSPLRSFSPAGTVGGIFNIGEVNTCATYTGEFLKISIDGYQYEMIAPTDSIGVSTFASSEPGYSKVTNITVKSYFAGNEYGNYSSNQIIFYHNNTTGVVKVYNSGTGPVTINVAPPLYFSQVFSNGTFPEITLTVVGPVGTGFIEGNFSWLVKFGANDKTVTGSFKVRNN